MDRRVEGLTLKVASGVLCITRKGDLRLLLFQLIQDLPIGDIAHLMILFHHDALLVACSILVFWHQGIASAVGLTDVAVQAAPALLAVAVIALSHGSVFSLSERPAQRFGTIITAKTSRARAFPIVFVAAPKLGTLKSFEVAIKARWTVIRAVTKSR